NNLSGETVITVPEEPFSLDLAAALVAGDYQWEFVDNGDNDYYKLSGAVYAGAANHYEWTTSGGMGTQENSGYIQTMNIFVPAAYVDGLDDRGSLIISTNDLNGYSADTAPVIYENSNAGYLTGMAGEISNHFKDNTVYLSEGFIYVSVGSRGRDIAASPASIVDLKAGIRYLRANSAVLPGSMDRIVSIGTSGGGAMSSLVGATGNMDEYSPYLYEQGAAGVEKQGESYVSTINDDVYAAQLYCPIADLENADLAYAWVRFDSSANGSGDRAYSFTEYQEVLEEDMALAYVDYFNSLELTDADGNALTLESAREGSYYDAVLGEISKALNAYIEEEAWRTYGVSESFGAPPAYPYAEMTESEWLKAAYGDYSSWLVMEDSTYRVTDLAAFFEGTNLNRNKEIPGFDDLNRSKEGNAFSSDPAYHSHFSQSIYNVMAENNSELSSLAGYDSSYLEAWDEANSPEIINQVYLYSAMQILANEDQDYDAAPYWRMRNGTADEHTSFSVNYNIGLTLQKYVPGVSIDYALVWNMPHGAREGTTTGTFSDWVNSICK
ncbi:MAG: hypothetical protein PQJ50_17640, partial [Spirochaetales bacterium]|nr:hypothetical protein [Spirochaetales bacterium]